MNTSYKSLVIITLLMAGLSSCKKDANNNNAFTGTWVQTRLHLYNTGTEKYDTTYQQPFGVADNIKITGAAAIVSVGHYYYPNIENYPKKPQSLPAQLVTYNYTEIAGKLVLNPSNKLVNPGGFVTTDTLSINGNTLLLHTVDYGHGTSVQSIADAYYTKQ
jgi:hypothetical protein